MKWAKDMTDAEISAEIEKHWLRWDKTRASVEQSGGASGSPGEWIIERLWELETERKKRMAAP